jgi:hypothetical protein
MKDQKPIVFTADKIRISGPRIDGSYTVTFETGEYEQEKISEILKLPQQAVVEVSVHVRT